MPANARPPKKRTATLVLAYLLLTLGLALATLALILFLHESGAKSGPPPPLPQLVKSPGESLLAAPIAKPKPSLIDSYDVAPDLPKFIEIPAINIGKTRVLSLGLSANNEIAVPSNSYDTGWYNGSSKPGQDGAMFIYGHVAGWNEGGIFYNLGKLEPGDRIFITRGDDVVFTYKVISKKLYPADKVDMSAVLSPIDPDKPGLNLMTCTWDIVDHKSEFLNRQVVFTQQIAKS